MYGYNISNIYTINKTTGSEELDYMQAAIESGVYDIDGIPEYEEIDMETTNKEPDGYIVSY